MFLSQKMRLYLPTESKQRTHWIYQGSNKSLHIDTLLENELIERVQKEKNSKILVYILSEIGAKLFDLKYPFGSPEFRRISHEKEEKQQYMEAIPAIDFSYNEKS